MATRLKDTDVVIIGLGAAGGVAALPLAQAGLEVIGLEAGTWLTRRDFAPDELRNNYRGWPQAVQKANQEIPTSRATASSPTGPRGNIHPMQNSVGGTTLHYWAQSWRLNPWDFKVVSETTRRYGASRIPKGSTVEDWPFGYEELEPYYDKIEYEVGVSGQAGNINGTIDPRGNPFEAPRKRGYPMPPLRGTAFIEKMAAAAKNIGWHPFPGPAAINSRSYQNRSGCMYHGFCNRGGCHVDAKNSTAVTTIPRAQATGHLKVVTRAHVTTIEVDRQRADDRRQLRDRRRRVLPAGEGRAARQLHLREHPAAAALEVGGLSQRAVEQSQTGRAATTSATIRARRYRRSFRSTWTAGTACRRRASRWTTGPTTTSITRRSTSSAARTSGPCRTGGRSRAAGMNTFGRAPGWGSQWKAFIKENADRSHSSYIQKTTLPYEDNFLDLDPVVKDPLGYPVCRVTAEFKDNERKIAAFSQDKMEQWYREAGAIAVQRAPVGGAMGVSTHAYGGTRMGDNPETNVVNRFGFSHEVPNLGVLGASVMGTSGARNPTLTAQALAWRTAEHLVKNWKKVSTA